MVEDRTKVEAVGMVSEILGKNDQQTFIPNSILAVQDTDIKSLSRFLVSATSGLCLCQALCWDKELALPVAPYAEMTLIKMKRYLHITDVYYSSDINMSK